jgi:hypothetical protein
MRGAPLFLIDAAIKSCDKSCCRNTKRVAYFEEGSEGDGSARFNLLPMARGKSQRNHVFLSISLAFAEALDSSSKSAEEFAFVNHV